MTRMKFVSSRKLEYCRRPTEPAVYEQPKSCHWGDNNFWSFRQAKQSEDITVGLLLRNGIAIDVIDAYMLYLETGKGEDGFICACTWFHQQQFGARCEYVFPFLLPSSTVFSSLFGSFLETLEQRMIQVKHRQRDVNNDTCYSDLPECVTQAGMCLHWNQICDGQ